VSGGSGGDRRQRGDRREAVPGGGRRGATSGTSPLQYVLRSIASVVVLAAIIVFTVRQMRPVFAGRGTLAEELRRHAPGVANAMVPSDSTRLDQLMATPQMQQQKRAFFEDVMRLKQVDSARADSIAQFAVREAYVRKISPAIIFGVMLAENARFISGATSNVGAVGLMQVYPKIWLTKQMTDSLGKDLATDSTNVKYGVFILDRYFHPKTRSGATKDVNWATALLHYNGCVKGTNTPRCHTYPAKVKRFVETEATSICNGRGFFDCIAKPFIEGLFGGAEPADSAASPPAGSPQRRTAPTGSSAR
jgi:hypothetical protein